MFYSCANLTSVTIPGSVTSIGDSAFSACIKLTSITVTDSVTNIGYSAFNACTALINVTMGTNHMSMRKYTHVQAAAV